MANPEHLAKLKEGVEAWNKWKAKHILVNPDLSGADLRGKKLREADLDRADLRRAKLQRADLTQANLFGADFTRANLEGADLSGTMLSEANFTKAHLARADFRDANLSEANFTDADLHRVDLGGTNLYGATLHRAFLRGAEFTGAHLREADFQCADLQGADLRQAMLVETNLEGANLTACKVFGISVWDVRMNGATQSNLIITPHHRSVIQVDNLEVAQFIYLLLNNDRVRKVIETINSKVVLILGRFTERRKKVLDAIRDELRKRDYLPVLFDFDPASSQTTIDTISTLAHMSRFIVADLTDAKSILGELERITTTLQLVPVQLILQKSADIPPMADSFLARQSVLQPYYYVTQEQLIASLTAQVIAPAAAKAEEFHEKLAAIREQYLPWQQPRCQKRPRRQKR